MAIDTREKRANVPGVGRPWLRDKFPSVDLDEQWRIASGNAYGGNALSAPVVVTAGYICVQNPSISVPKSTGVICIPSATCELEC